MTKKLLIAITLGVSVLIFSSVARAEDYHNATFLSGLRDINVMVMSVRRGSGVFIAPSKVLTCAHLVVEGGGIIVDVGDTTRTGIVIYKSESIDLALIKTNWNSPKYIPGLQLNPEVGEQVYIVSSLGEFEDLIMFGRIALVTKDDLVIDATILPGMSGAGIFDQQGLLVGIVRQFWGDLRNKYGDFLMIAVPAWQIKEFLEE